MAKKSAGILMYRREKEIEVLLVHPGGPFFSRKDLGSWSIPKGEYGPGDDPLAAARREFLEETGQEVNGDATALATITQKSGKEVKAWAVEGNLDTQNIVCNTFEIEWPPKSGKRQTFPEIDKAEWFSIEKAREKINEGQAAILDELQSILEKTTPH